MILEFLEYQRVLSALVNLWVRRYQETLESLASPLDPSALGCLAGLLFPQVPAHLEAP